MNCCQTYHNMNPRSREMFSHGEVPGQGRSWSTIFSLVFAAPDATLDVMYTGSQSQPHSESGDSPHDLTLNPGWCSSQATWRQRRRFQEAAHKIIYLPHDDRMDYVWSEADWLRLVPADAQEEAVLVALSQATGVYFFPSREWLAAFGRFSRRLRLRRVLEAGAGRGYLAAALAPLMARQDTAFKAVDNAQGEFETGLVRHPVVASADALPTVHLFRPDLIVYAWPPPGQSIGPLCRSPGVRYVLVLGEPDGGCTGDPADWQRFRYRYVRTLSRYGLGRSGRRRQAATLFFGAASPQFRDGM
jgi:hypothetical protein